MGKECFRVYVHLVNEAYLEGCLKEINNGMCVMVTDDGYIVKRGAENVFTEKQEFMKIKKTFNGLHD